jgi:hypothetical protein
MTEEDEAFNEIERRSIAKKDAVKAQLDKPQRTWVGLTANELSMIGDSMKTWNSFSITDVYFAIEAKLKEKNT